MNSRSRKKVAILAEPLDLQSAGIHMYLKNLIKGLPNNSDLTYHLIRAREFADSYGMHNQYIKSNSGILGFFWRKIFRLPRFLNKEDYDLVVEPAHFGPFNLKNTIKRVTIIHDLTPIMFPEYHKFYSSIVHKLFLGHICKKAHLIIVNSYNTKKDLIHHYPITKDKIKVIYPEINSIYEFNPSRTAVEENKIQGDFILSVGTIEPRKNFLSLLKAYEIYRSKDPGNTATLVIVGKKGWKTKAFYDHLDSSEYKDSVLILHKIDNEQLSQLYSHCHLFVLPSHYEGFGFPLLEAYQCGALCIAANNSSLCEVAKDFGIFYKSNDHNELAEILTKELSKEKQLMPVKPPMPHQLNFSMEFHMAISELLQD